MNETPTTDDGSLPLSGLLRVDQACLRFEAAWKAGRQPPLDDFLGEATGPERAALLKELILLDVSFRRLRGEGPGRRTTSPASPRWTPPGWRGRSPPTATPAGADRRRSPRTTPEEPRPPPTGTARRRSRRPAKRGPEVGRPPASARRLCPAVRCWKSWAAAAWGSSTGAATAACGASWR
jgi:hypothetical protein